MFRDKIFQVEQNSSIDREANLALSEGPVGAIELTDEELGQVAGGHYRHYHHHHHHHHHRPHHHHHHHHHHYYRHHRHHHYGRHHW